MERICLPLTGTYKKEAASPEFPKSRQEDSTDEGSAPPSEDSHLLRNPNLICLC